MPRPDRARRRLTAACPAVFFGSRSVTYRSFPCGLPVVPPSLQEALSEACRRSLRFSGNCFPMIFLWFFCVFWSNPRRLPDACPISFRRFLADSRCTSIPLSGRCGGRVLTAGRLTPCGCVLPWGVPEPLPDLRAQGLGHGDVGGGRAGGCGRTFCVVVSLISCGNEAMRMF